MNRLRILALLPLCAVLAACDMVVLNPSGDIAAQQRDLLVVSTVLMLLIIVPVMALTLFFAWRYRASNREARYEPDWHHSMRLELVIWSAPLLIIICLGAITWLGTHLLDPYRPLDRIHAGKAVPEQAQPLEVQVVALDWKWLFIYPEQGIATVNELAVPVDRPLSLSITASSVMNSLYIPELAGMIYAMPGMETKLHAVLNRHGESEGFSANYSGAGFSGMRFRLRGLDDGEFANWVESARTAQASLTRETYLELEKPSEKEPVRHFAAVDAQLFDAVLGMCVQPGKMCMHDMMAIDAKGGLGLGGVYNVARSTESRPRAVFGAAHDYVIGMCTAPVSRGEDETAPFARVDRSPLRGAGLTPAVGPASAGLYGVRLKPDLQSDLHADLTVPR
ncbi:MAG TPA: ubiquinol oxidase subunit II [Povalibacter sp.]|uniref:ubiquinol oxidase subunit II n=1 Tax=Povalibacter sp. TaxID=1962978 RepID=UPI002CBEC9D7|nr:ubiquinol oxidase subunit II [Povalibacter sp.]HMN43900.1 ubiquinol oxidase subunit II [Povalibacter sp.]